MKTAHLILKILRKLYTKTFGRNQLPPLQREEDPDKASEMIYNLLSDDKPCMIARFGANELNSVINYLGVNAKNILSGNLSRVNNRNGGGTKTSCTICKTMQVSFPPPPRICNASEN